MLGGDPDAELVRHFLIETTSKGVRLKGCNSEPTFGELNISIAVEIFRITVIVTVLLVTITEATGRALIRTHTPPRNMF